MKIDLEFNDIKKVVVNEKETSALEALRLSLIRVNCEDEQGVVREVKNIVEGSAVLFVDKLDEILPLIGTSADLPINETDQPKMSNWSIQVRQTKGSFLLKLNGVQVCQEVSGKGGYSISFVATGFDIDSTIFGV